MEKCLKAGFILSIVFVVICAACSILCFAMAPVVDTEEQRIQCISNGITLAVYTGIFIFDIIISKLAQKSVAEKRVTIAMAVLTIISGVASNVANIPAGILMIINRNKINA